MKLSIILLTWNSGRFAENCLQSIYHSTGINDFEVIVVDNGSKDGTLQMIENSFPMVRLIKNSTNRGVAPARNQGIREAKGEYIAILDIDTIVRKDAFGRLLGYLDKTPDTGIGGPQLIFEDGMVQKSCRRFPLIHAKLLRRLEFRWAKQLLESELYSREMQSGHPVLVDYVIGACQFIRKKALEEVGLLDERIFYGPEDVDLCLRMWLKGWKVVYISDAQVIHFEQRITKKAVFSKIALKHFVALLYYFYKHRYLFSRKRIYKKIKPFKD